MKKISFFLILSSLFFAIFFQYHRVTVLAESASDYYRERLEFDKDGTLRMTTHDRKATSDVTYRTLGWIIKRYDAPLSAKGQQYAVIELKEPSDIRYRDDPENKGYMYCYFYGDKNEIYNAIGKADSNWQKQLYKYGDRVYIDEVMTVCTKGVALGTLLGSSSNCIRSTGQIYTDYAGIAGARPWASAVSLRTHFDKSVMFPSQVKAPEFFITENPVDTINYVNNPVAIGTMGNNMPGMENYNVSQGIPVLEKVYASVRANEAMYDINYTRYLGYAYLPVRVTTTYHYEWKDLNGVQHKENVRVNRWYEVKRSFSYWRVQDVKYAYLESATVKNKALPDEVCTIRGNKSIKISMKKAAGYGKHISMSNYTETVHTDGGVVKGRNGLRPSVPDDDFSKKAGEAVGQYIVRNDYLKIGTNVVLTNEKSVTRGINPVNMNNNTCVIVSDSYEIPKMRANADYAGTGTVTYKYTDGTVKKIKIQNFNAVSVHTPIVCNIELNTDAGLNQEVYPYDPEKTVVLGNTFGMKNSTLGMHREVKGYGYSDYRKYLGRAMLKAGCDIVYKGKKYRAGSWIDVTRGGTFMVPVGTKEGNYDVILKNYAINYSYDRPEESIQYANMAQTSYAAEDRTYIRVIGSIYGCTVDTGGDKYAVDKMPMKVEMGKDKVTFNITTVGDYGGNDATVRMTIDWCCNMPEGMIQVWLYRKADYGYERISDEIIAERTADDTGMQKWRAFMDLSGEICIVPAYKSADVISAESIEKAAIYDRDIIINADIYTYRDENPVLTYMNGLCNMWKREGFNYRNVYKDGDCLTTGLTSITKNEYNVVGTH